jgi:homocysteine S-methyltransferase
MKRTSNLDSRFRGNDENQLNSSPIQWDDMAGDNISSRERFRKRLQGPPILADGAMGTELYARGVYINRCYDELNASQPELVAAVHLDYLKAGAELIETNTYGANRFKLTPHGLGERVTELNRSGVQIARRAVGESGREAFIAGSMGPLGRRLAPIGKLKVSEAREAFTEQARGLIDGGADVIIVETMVDPNELACAVKAVREISDLPVIAQFTLSDYNESAYGATLERIAGMLAGLDIDVIGINCSIGPSKLFEAAKRLMELSDKPVSIQPNAGEVEMFEGRMICRATPEYFAEYARRMVLSGVKIVGGCCGSTPAHTRAMDAALRSVAPGMGRVRTVVTVPEVKPERLEEALPYRELSPMAAALADGRFIYSVEINPPRSPMVKRVLERVQELKEAGVDLINIPDGPRASARLSAMVLAYIIRQQVGLDVILHYTCRDRNILGIQSDLLGAEALGLDNILCVTGDPPKLGDYPMATAVYDVDAIGLLRIADNLNHSQDLAGNPIPRGTTFHLGCGANPGAVDLNLEIERLHRKLENGARYVLTQPLFDEERFFRFLDQAKLGNVPVLVGILPLASYRNAEFFHNEVPGMDVPQPIRDRLQKAGESEAAAAVGVEIAAEALTRCAPRAAGAYIMPPFGRTELALQVIKLFRKM